jgi:hypothetical protein
MAKRSSDAASTMWIAQSSTVGAQAALLADTGFIAKINCPGSASRKMYVEGNRARRRASKVVVIVEGLELSCARYPAKFCSGAGSSEDDCVSALMSVIDSLGNEGVDWIATRLENRYGPVMICSNQTSAQVAVGLILVTSPRHRYHDRNSGLTEI